jgi:glycerol 2-dehydrogenase (NADP+)
MQFHPGQKGSFVPTWQAMTELVSTGKTRAIGVSNFSIAEVEEILPYAKDTPISCNQVEVHPWLPQTELITFMKQHDILTTCYSPFAGQKADGASLLKDQTILELARKNNMDVGQLLQSWAVQRGTVPLGKSQTECEFAAVPSLVYGSQYHTDADPSARIKSNLAIQKLSAEDVAAIDALEIPDSQGRTIDYTGQWGVKLFTN